MATLLWLSLALPTAFSIATRFVPGRDALVAATGALLSAVPPGLLLASAGAGEHARSAFTWLPAGGVELGLRLDGLSAAMSSVVASVGLAIVVYTGGYLTGDARRPSALAGLLGFLAAMQGLVLADGYLTLLIFWELVGAASARLIAFARDEPTAPAAAVRAFLTTRTADLGLYVAVLSLFAATGTLAFGTERPDGALGALVGLGLVLAAMGKSAQAPFQTWLSAAMAGPTPVSALLHSATMVAAGVYLLIRSDGLLAGWPLTVAAWIGALTAVAGAGLALAQSDLKRVLAGSTTSQLGLMFVGAAVGGPAVAVFHLVAHAAGKAGLFLAAGVFQHNRNTTALAGLRGAGRDDRLVFGAFAVCALSIAGVPPLAAFWSKEHIAAAAEPHAAWFVLVMVAAAGSAAYLLRPALVLWAADGGRRAPARRGRTPMLAGLGVLTLGSIGLGALGGPLTRLLGQPALPGSTLGLALSMASVGAGAGALVVFRRRVPAAFAVAFRRQLYTDKALRASVERPTLAVAAGLNAVERRVVDIAVDGVGRAGLAFARTMDGVERRIVDAAVDGLGRAGLVLARWMNRVERRKIDAAVDGLAALVGRGGDDLRRVQSGRLFDYLRDAVLGAFALGLVIAIASLT